METVGGESSETGLVMKKGKQKSTTCIGASLPLDYRDKEESNNIATYLHTCPERATKYLIALLGF